MADSKVADRPAKRARRDDGDESGTEKQSARLRKEACARFPQLCASAQAAVSVEIRCRACCEAASFAPPFTHQVFPEETIYGFADPKIVVGLQQPALMMSVKAASFLEGEAAADAAALGVPQDDVRSCLKLGVSEALLEAMLSTLAPAGARSSFTPLDIRASEPEPPHVAVPPGACVARYKRSDRAAHPEAAGGSSSGASAAHSRQFVVHRWSPADDPALVALHDRMQTLATWLIESASPIDARDPKWTVYGLWEVMSDVGHAAARELAGATSSDDGAATAAHAPAAAPAAGAGAAPHLHFVGYATTYLFTNPFAKGGRPNTVRLAQLVILPHYQRQQHGLRLLAAIHRDAQGAGADVPADAAIASGGVTGGAGAAAAAAAAADASASSIDLAPSLGLDAAEVSVESPCEGMRVLRDCYDTAHAAAAAVFEARLGNVLPLLQLPPALAAAFESPAAAGSHASSAGPGDTEAVASAAPAAGAAVTGTAPLPLIAGDAIAPLDAPAALGLAPLSATAIRRILRTPTGQVYRSFEALFLARIDRADGESMRRFRLAVKRRLYDTDEDVAAVTDASKRKGLLDLLYHACLADYARTLGALRAIPREEAAALHAEAAATVKQLEAELEKDAEDRGDE